MNFESGYQGLKPNADPQRWSATKELLTDEKLTIEGHPVMERWETPFTNFLEIFRYV